MSIAPPFLQSNFAGKKKRKKKRKKRKQTKKAAN